MKQQQEMLAVQNVIRSVLSPPSPSPAVAATQFSLDPSTLYTLAQLQCPLPGFSAQSTGFLSFPFSPPFTRQVKRSTSVCLAQLAELIV